MKLDNKRLEKEKYGKEILSFFRVMSNKYPFCNPDTLSNKLNTIQITSQPSSIKEVIIKCYKDHPCGFYPESNKILFIKDDIKDYHIYHELLHAFSTYIEDKTVFCGFSQRNRKTYLSMGDGLNEGYTQLLKERYFNVDDKEIYFYMLEKHIAKHLEIIIGRRKMEKYYAEANLYDLMKQLEIYSTKDDILYFINNVDYINANVKNEELNEEVNIKLKESLMYLLNTYINKETILLNKGVLDDKTYKNNIEKYLELLANSLYYRGKDYQALSYQDVEYVLNNNNLVPSGFRR